MYPLHRQRLWHLNRGGCPHSHPLSPGILRRPAPLRPLERAIRSTMDLLHLLHHVHCLQLPVRLRPQLWQPPRWSIPHGDPRLSAPEQRAGRAGRHLEPPRAGKCHGALLDHGMDRPRAGPRRRWLPGTQEGLALGVLRAHLVRRRNMADHADYSRDSRAHHPSSQGEASPQSQDSGVRKRKGASREAGSVHHERLWRCADEALGHSLRPHLVAVRHLPGRYIYFTVHVILHLSDCIPGEAWMELWRGRVAAHRDGCRRHSWRQHRPL